MQLLNMYMCVTVSDTDWDTDWVAKYSQSGKKTQDRPRLNVYNRATDFVDSQMCSLHTATHYNIARYTTCTILALLN